MLIVLDNAQNAELDVSLDAVPPLLYFLQEMRRGGAAAPFV
jgi:hypothetical protein